jgi:hypothetical protein
MNATVKTEYDVYCLKTDPTLRIAVAARARLPARFKAVDLGSVKGTKIWAGDCAAAPELRGATQSMPQQGIIAPQGTTNTDPRAEPLGDKLARSDGVLCPLRN